MLIHTVMAGDTLRSIAERYGSSTRELLRLNELESQDLLVNGLHLLVPGPSALAAPYTPAPGDTVDTLARRLRVTPEELRGWLGLAPTENTLGGGELLYVPRRVARQKRIEVNGYLVPEGTTSDAGTIREARDITFLSVFSYQTESDGSLRPLRDTVAIEAAKRQRIMPLMTVTNFDGNNFNTQLAHTILVDARLRRQLIANIRETAVRAGFRGVNLDFEHMDAADRPLYNQFIREVADMARRASLSISIALGPKTADLPQAEWMGAFDYRALGESVDFLMLMTYEWGWVGGPPMAVAPLHQVRAVLQYATSVIPANKILMGISLYGYDWVLPHRPGRLASSISNNSAQNLAVSMQSQIRWDPLAASPFFNYQSGGEEHVVWFDDALSVAAKLQLIYDFNLRGASYWLLGNSFPQNWQLLLDSFVVRKG